MSLHMSMTLGLCHVARIALGVVTRPVASTLASCHRAALELLSVSWFQLLPPGSRAIMCLIELYGL
jgi:hypothetical protein